MGFSSNSRSTVGKQEATPLRNDNYKGYKTVTGQFCLLILSFLSISVPEKERRKLSLFIFPQSKAGGYSPMNCTMKRVNFEGYVGR